MRLSCPLDAVETVSPIGSLAQVAADANPVPSIYMTAGVAIVVLLVLALVYDIWALHAGRRTISQFWQHFSKAWQWFKWLSLTALVFFGWHVVFGFPWSLRYQRWRNRSR